MTRKSLRSAASSLQPHDVLNYRALAVRSKTVNVEGRSVEAVVATEAPVTTFDWDRYEYIPEILLMSGCEFPSSRQVPFLDTHARYSITSQLGSIRGLRIDGDKLIGDPTFATTDAAEDAFTQVREGHVTDISVGYKVLEKTFVPEGTNATVNGRNYAGPVNLVTKWKVREGSACPIGADEEAKMRGLDPAQVTHQITLRQRALKGAKVMSEALRALLVELGMRKEATEEEALAFAKEHLRKPADNDPPSDPPPRDPQRSGKKNKKRRDGERALTMADLEEVVRRARENERAEAKKFQDEVRKMGELAGVSDEVIRSAGHLADLEAARAFILEKRADRQDLGHVYEGPAQRDKHLDLVRTALSVRCMDESGYQQRRDQDGNLVGTDLREKVLPVAQRAKGYEEFRFYSLRQLSTECLMADGFSYRALERLTAESLAIAALGWPGKVGLRSASGPAYNVPSSFSLLIEDAINKAMMLGYEEFPSTWEGPMRRGSSVADFKDIRRYRLGAVPNLPVWPDNSDPAKASMANAREKYAVEARSLEIGFSYRLLVNDDMDALSRTPFQLGNAARRTVNAVAWAEVTSNPTMSDGVALFSAASGNRKRSNLTTGAATPTSSTLQTMTNKMMQMRGENTPENNEGSDILNLQPRFIIGPSALRTTILQLVLSAFDPVANQFQVANVNSNLTPVIEPLLDATSTTAWYLSASPSQIDTVEITFLQGQETPVVRDWVDERNLSHNFTVLQTFAAKAMNHRGFQRHDGA